MPKHEFFAARLLAVLAFCALCAPAHGAVITWDGLAEGAWLTPGNWDPDAVPNNSATQTYDVFVDGGDTQNTRVVLDGNVTVNSLTVDSGDLVSVAASRTLNLSNSLAGAVETQAASARITLTGGVMSGVSHTGAGTLFASGTSVSEVTNSSVLALENGVLSGQIVNNGELAIAGSNGRFGTTSLEGVGTITGGGTLTAIPFDSVLTIQGVQTLDDASLVLQLGTLELAGTLEARNGSLLRTVGTQVVGTGSGGRLITESGSAIILDQGLVENIDHSGTGVLSILGGFTLGTVRGVTNTATLHLNDFVLDGRVTNEGLLLLQNGFFTTGEIAGTGTISAGGFGGLRADAADSVLRFSGAPVFEGAHTRIEGGTVEAAGPLSLTGGSRLTISDSSLLGVGGMTPIDLEGTSALEIQAGSVLANVRLTGAGAAIVTDSTVRDVDNSVLLALENSVLSGRIVNNGELAIAGSNGRFGTTSLEGVGTITGGGTLTAIPFDSVLTIQGVQTLDDASLVLQLGTLELAGTLEARNGSLLRTVGTQVVGTGSGGRLITESGSAIILDQGLVENIDHSGTGVLSILGGFTLGTVRGVTNTATLHLNDFVLDGRVTNEGLLLLQNGDFTTGEIAGTGTIGSSGTMRADAADSVLRFLGAPVFETAGTRIEGGAVEAAGPLSLTAGSRLTIRDSSLLGVGGMTPINIDGTSALEIQAGSVLANVRLTGAGAAIVTDSTVRDVDNSVLLSLDNSLLSGRIVNSGRMVSGDGLTIGAGTQLASSQGTIVGNVLVEEGGTLSGGGDIFGNVTVSPSGIIGADGAASTLDIFGNLSLEGLLFMEIGAFGTVPGYDQLNLFDNSNTAGLEGTGFLGGDLVVSFLDSFMPTSGNFFDLFTANALFDNGLTVTALDLDPTLGFGTRLLQENGRAVYRLDFFTAGQPVPVPEPVSLWLLLAGLAGIRWARRRSVETSVSSTSL